MYDSIEELKKLLKDEDKVLDILNEVSCNEISILPILHNEDVIILQLNGWSINLYKDGTWIWTATDGG